MPLSRTEYYNLVKQKAYEIRDKYDLKGPRILPGMLKKILKKEGVKKVVEWRDFKRLRGAYLIESDGTPIVVVKKFLPRDPLAFTLAHELKHHLMDRGLGGIICSISNVREEIEIGAEIFAAELIYPEQLFLNDLLLLGINKDNFKPEHILELKRSNDTTLSHQSLAKRVMFLKIAPKGSLEDIKWIKLEEAIYGAPEYKRFIRHRKNSA